jgi:hypothetical protein
MVWGSGAGHRARRITPRTGLITMKRLLLPSLLMLAACTHGLYQPDPNSQAELEQQKLLWQQTGISDYSYDFGWSCFCPDDYTRRVRIFVQGNQISRITDLNGILIPDSSLAREYYTIDGLFDFLIAEHDRADSVTVSFEPVLHYPTHGWIDYYFNYVDDEMGFWSDNFISLRGKN